MRSPSSSTRPAISPECCCSIRTAAPTSAYGSTPPVPRGPPDSTTSPSRSPDKAAIEALAAGLTALGEQHAGVHFATIGWILPELHDPDGHEVRFYTASAHTPAVSGQEPLVIDDAVATASRREVEWEAQHPDGSA